MKENTLNCSLDVLNTRSSLSDIIEYVQNKVTRPGMVAHACNPNYLGGWDKKITWTQEAEIAVSQDPTTALQPRWQSKILFKKKRLHFTKPYNRLRRI